MNVDLAVGSQTALLFKRSLAMIVAFFLIGSINFGQAYYYETDYAEDDFAFEPEEMGLMMDEEGYLTKAVPSVIGENNYQGREGVVVHKVSEGETLSEIASAYGLKPATIIWENDLYNPDRLKISQELVILPVDGVSHKVKKGDTVEKIAKKYKGDKAKIAEANNLVGNELEVDQKVIIPGGQKVYETPRYIASNRGDSSSRNVGTISKVNIVPKGNKILIFPTKGKITQGYHAGHYAIDIGNVSKPSVWAAATGKVVKTGSGWSGGYGKHVIIDHGDGKQSLYAHLERIDVVAGQIVDQGQVIGKMGKTGRVYGKTGIHLHFEFRVNGVKKYPGNYW